MQITLRGRVNSSLDSIVALSIGHGAFEIKVIEVLTLTLLRHAKSSWADVSLDDFDRPLAPRGRKAAPAMAAALLREEVCPDLILCSPSVRTRQTLALILHAAGGALPRHAIVFDRRLYHAAPDGLLGVVAEVAPRYGHVMVIGHNPGLHELVLRIGGPGDGAAVTSPTITMPTAAVAVIDFPALEAWPTVAAARGRLRLYMTPATEEERADDPADR